MDQADSLPSKTIKRLNRDIRLTRLTRKQQQFVRLVALGENHTEAYIQAGYNPGSRDSAKVGAHLLFYIPKINKAIMDLKNAAWRANRLEKIELESYCADAVRTPVGQIDESSPLAQEVTYETTTSKSGAVTQKKKVKMVPKLEAAKLASDLQGFTDNNHSNLNPFQFLVTLNLNTPQIDPKPIQGNVIENG